MKNPVLDPPSAQLASSLEQAAGRKRVRWWSSYALLALIFLIAIDVLARVVVPQDRYSSPNRSWAWWAVKDLRHDGPHPDIALCGSSLMLAVLHDGDSTYENRIYDAVLHHRDYALEDLLEKATGKSVRTASVAIGGQMASDVYALTTVALSGEYKPRTIIWGIAPRDFVDATFFKPETSETVRYMAQISDRNPLENRSSFWSELERKLGHIIYVYGTRAQAIAAQVEATRSALAAVGFKDLESVHCPPALLHIAVAELPDDNGLNQWNVSPYAPNAPKFADNTQEYRERYNPFRRDLFENQLRFFDKTLRYCKDHGIHVVLVNMPLTQTNLKLLPAGVYDKYRARTEQIAHDDGAELLDFNRAGLFQPKEFADTVHLNGLGAVHFWRLLVSDHAKELTVQ